MIVKIRPKEENKIHNYNKSFPGIEGIFRTGYSIPGYVYFFYVNTNQDYKLKETLNLTCEGLEICNPYDDP
jgi:hypothetical protein